MTLELVSREHAAAPSASIEFAQTTCFHALRGRPQDERVAPLRSISARFADAHRAYHFGLDWQPAGDSLDYVLVALESLPARGNGTRPVGTASGTSRSSAQ